MHFKILPVLYAHTATVIIKTSTKNIFALSIIAPAVTGVFATHQQESFSPQLTSGLKFIPQNFYRNL